MAFPDSDSAVALRRVGAHGERGRAKSAGRRAVAGEAVSNGARLRGIVAGRVKRRLLLWQWDAKEALAVAVGTVRQRGRLDEPRAWRGEFRAGQCGRQVEGFVGAVGSAP